ncbi:MAG: MtrB/PioB family decaheme-associated outer membrane protein [Rhodanobacter sp.]|jgi:MtrB/PioB family decaheme-associated outer membrane protein|nr:MtrB/PioB family decaheme-associated outer membrane protein [Rhodanobacter sp.]
MKSVNGVLSVKSLVLAILSVLPLVAFAQSDDDVSILTKPTNFVELGLGNVSSDSYNFGQYNGLGKSGIFGIGSLGVQGGDAYGQGPGTRRWSIAATNLGTDIRAVDATIRDQGHWMFGLDFAQQHHDIADFWTPLQGSMGGNVFTMPEAFGTVNTRRPSTAIPYGTQVLTPTQVGYFHKVNVHTDRYNTGVTFGYNFNPKWNVQLNWKHIEQSGAKLISSGTDENNTSAGATLAGYSAGGERIQMLMNPTDYTTDNIDFALNWAGTKAFFTAGYFGSRFVDNYSSVSFPNPFDTGTAPNGSLLGAPYPVNALSTPPSNDFNQVNFSGGYNLTPTTHLVGGYSYGRNTQNMGYVNQDQMAPGGLPVNSLHGLVITTHADVKLTNQTTKDLSLSAGIKYNEHDNQTQAYTYTFLDLGGEAQTSFSIPLSYKTTEGTLDGDYRITSGQRLHFGYEYKDTRRGCDNAVPVDSATGIPVGADVSATNTGYYQLVGVLGCVAVPKEELNKFVVNYRANASDALNFNAGYAYSDRNSTVNPAFYSPLQANSEGFENYNYQAFFDGSRRQQMLKGGVNFQASDKLNLSMDMRGTKDEYYDSVLGVQQGKSGSVNLDAAYQISEKTSASVYANWQYRSRDMVSTSGRNSVGTSGLTGWSNNLIDKGSAFGFNLKHDGLMHGKLDLKVDASYSLDTTRYNTQSYTTAAIPGVTCATAPRNSGYNCGSTPNISSELLRAALTANYHIDKRSSVAAGYIFQKLNSNDYYYNFYQLGSTGTTTMPTNQPSPSYTENVVFVAYRYSFM